jgi:hypothetical protein
MNATSGLMLVAFMLAGSIALAQGVDPATVPDVLVRANRTVLPRVSGPAEDYSRHCQGCHGHLGVSVTEMPRLRDRVGYFLHTPAGRAYVVQVPNVLQAHLSDERLAAMMNWVVQEFSPAQLPADFKPYAADEIAALRAQRIPSVPARRRDVVEQLVEAGVVESAEVLSFSFQAGRY